MRRYASQTSVSVAKSKGEIEDIVTRYGATSFASLQGNGMAAIVFEAMGRRVQFELPLPKQSEFATRKLRGRDVKADPQHQHQVWEQACRQRWRALALVVKAKLEAVASGITTFEDEFLAHIVLPNGGTVGKWLRPQLADAYESRAMPPLLLGSGS